VQPALGTENPRVGGSIPSLGTTDNGGIPAYIAGLSPFYFLGLAAANCGF